VRARTRRQIRLQRGRTRALRLLLPALLALATTVLVGCSATPIVPSLDEQIKRAVNDAVLALWAQPCLAIRTTVSLRTGGRVVRQFAGSGAYCSGNQWGSTTFLMPGNARLTVIAKGRYLYENRPAAVKASTPWIGFDLTKLSRRLQYLPPEVASPGLDPIQMPELLHGATWRDVVIAARMTTLSIAGAEGIGITDYRLVLDLRKLARHLGPIRQRVMLATIGSTGAYDASITVRIRQRQVLSIRSDMPMLVVAPAAHSPSQPNGSSRPVPVGDAHVTAEFVPSGPITAPIPPPAPDLVTMTDATASLPGH